MKTWLRASLAFAAATTVSLSLAGCTTPTAQPTNAAFKPHVEVILGTESPAYAASLLAGAEAAAKEFGVILDWHSDTLNGTAAQQIALINQLVSKQPEGYIITPIDDSVQAYVDLAASTHADVVNLDSHVPTLDNVMANIFDDSNAGGIKLADAIASAIGYQKGGSYQIGVGVVNPNDQVTLVRLSGFNYELGAKYPGIKVVGTAVSNSQPGKAATQVSGLFAKNPKLAGFVAMDSFTATAAASLVEGSGLNVPLVAYDADPDHVALLKKGVFKTLIAQNPAQKIRLAIQLIADHQLKGQPPQMRDQIFGNVILDMSSSKADLKKYSYLAPGN